jgi:hypothetical protein
MHSCYHRCPTAILLLSVVAPREKREVLSYASDKYHARCAASTLVCCIVTCKSTCMHVLVLTVHVHGGEQTLQRTASCCEKTLHSNSSCATATAYAPDNIEEVLERTSNP